MHHHYHFHHNNRPGPNSIYIYVVISAQIFYAVAEALNNFENHRTNTDYINSGAIVLEKSNEVFAQSDMIIKVKELQSNEFDLVKEEQIIFTYLFFEL